MMARLQDGEEEMEEAQQPKRSKAAAKSKKPAKRSRKGLDDDDEDEEEDSDGEGRKGAQGKQQHVRTGMVNRVQSVQRPVQVCLVFVSCLGLSKSLNPTCLKS